MKKQSGGAGELGLSEREKIDGRKPLVDTANTGIPAKQKSEKAGKHTLK